MVNRINLILQAKNITSKQFAEEIGVQPSGLSHILSGRNNPSLDFVMKVMRRYPEIDINWLMFGKGEMIAGAGVKSSVEKSTVVEIPSKMNPTATNPSFSEESNSLLDLFSEVGVPSANNNASNVKNSGAGFEPVVEPLPISSLVENIVQGKPTTSQQPFSSMNSPKAQFVPKQEKVIEEREMHSPVEQKTQAQFMHQAFPQTSDSVVGKDNPVAPIDENRKIEIEKPVASEKRILAKRKKVVKIIVMYEDNSFSEYYPEE